MSIEQTLGIIKPDAVEKQHIGAILAMVEQSGLAIRGMRLEHLSLEQAQGFYAEHKERPFFGELVEFMTRGPVVLLRLEGDNAVASWRALMGATDPAKAEQGTIRAKFGANIGENAVHGSDSASASEREIRFFFAA